MKWVVETVIQAKDQTWEVSGFSMATEKVPQLGSLIRLVIDLTGAWTSDVAEEDLVELTLRLRRPAPQGSQKKSG